MTNRTESKTTSRAALVCLLLVLCAAAVAAKPVSVEVAVESREVYAGEPFVFQITVNENDKPDKPDLSQIRDFKVQELGGRSNNSDSVTIINGRMNRVVRRGYVFSYRLTPLKTGTLKIPEIAVTVDGQKLMTRPVLIRVKEPVENKYFKLRLKLSRQKCYVGEPVTLTVTWYMGLEASAPEFNLPALRDDAFEVDEPDFEPDPQRKYYSIPLGSSEAVAELGRGTLDGKQYTTLTFARALIPKRAGVFKLPRATVGCQAITGYQRRRDPFDSFFSDDFFDMGRRAAYKKFVAPSNEPELTVLDLPEAGKPDDFSGIVGQLNIEAEAKPTEASVGDPITLSVKLSGPEHMKRIDLPPLQEIEAMARDFKIPEEMAEGTLQGGQKVFTQTIRAKHAEVKEIPSISISYFDTKESCYRTVSTKPIPLSIRPTRVVTAGDAEGKEPIQPRTRLEAWAAGIAHNYTDADALVDQDYGVLALARKPFWIALNAAPAFVFLLLLAVVTAVRRAQADPVARRAKRAYGEMAKRLNAVRAEEAAADACAKLLDVLRRYLGDKLNVPSASITYGDVEEALKNRGAGPEVLQKLQGVFHRSEATRYAGDSIRAADVDILKADLLAVGSELERSLK